MALGRRGLGTDSVVNCLRGTYLVETKILIGPITRLNFGRIWLNYDSMTNYADKNTRDYGGWDRSASMVWQRESAPKGPDQAPRARWAERGYDVLLLKRVIGGVVQSTPVLDLPVNSNSQRGLLSLALHPEFPDTPHVFIRWTESSTGADSTVVSDVPPPERVSNHGG